MDSAIFITSHERPDMYSYETLRRVGYTGKIYIVLDDKDRMLDEYTAKYEDVFIFNKEKYVPITDLGSSQIHPKLSAVLYPRLEVEQLAKELGLSTFVVMDDDVKNFRYRYPSEDGRSCKSGVIHNFDKVLDIYFEFMQISGAQCMSFTNNFMFVHGAASVFKDGRSFERRSCHNVFLRMVSRPLNWTFAMNEDYISALREGSLGNLWLVPPFVEEQLVDMNNFKEQKGGMFDFYQSTSSFERAFYATVACPWCCKPVMYGNKFVIGVDKDRAYQKIISSSFKKS